VPAHRGRRARPGCRTPANQGRRRAAFRRTAGERGRSPGPLRWRPRAAHPPASRIANSDSTLGEPYDLATLWAPCAAEIASRGRPNALASRDRQPSGGEGLVVQAARIGGASGVVAEPPGRDRQVAGRRPQPLAGPFRVTAALQSSVDGVQGLGGSAAHPSRPVIMVVGVDPRHGPVDVRTSVLPIRPGVLSRPGMSDRTAPAPSARNSRRSTPPCTVMAGVEGRAGW
jgi:hypothetical protein